MTADFVPIRRQREASVICPVGGCTKTFAAPSRSQAKRAVMCHIGALRRYRDERHSQNLDIALCIGPLHRVPAWLPKEEFWRRRNGGRVTWLDCKECERLKIYGDRNHGFVPAASVLPIARRLVDHYGSMVVAARAAGICADVLESVFAGRQRGMQKRTAAKLIITARDLPVVKRHYVPLAEVRPTVLVLIGEEGSYSGAARRVGVCVETVSHIVHSRYAFVRFFVAEKILRAAA